MASDSVSASVVPSETRTADDNQRSTREVCVYRFEAVQQRDGTTQLQRVEIEQWLASHTDYRLLVETVNGRISLRCACLSHFDEAGYRFEPSVGDASRAETGRRQRARIDAILDAARRNGSPSEFALATDLLQQRTGLVAAPNRLALLQVIRLLRRLAPGLIRIGVAARDFPRALALKAMYEQRFGKDRDIADTKLAELRFGNCLPPERIDAHGFREQHDRSALIFGGRGLVASQLPVDLLVLVDPEVMIYRRLSQPAFDGQRELICSAFQVADYIDSDHSPGAVRAWIGRHRDLTSTERAAIRFWMPGTVVSVDDLWRRQRPFEVECREIAVPTGSGCRAQRRHRFRSAVAEAIAAEIRTQQRPETGRVVVLVDDERTVQCVRSAIGSLRTRRGLSRPTVDVVTVGEFRRLVKQQCDVLHVAVTWPFDLRLGRFLPFPDPPLPSLKVVLWAREGHRFPDDPVADLMFGHFSVSREKEPKPAEYGSNVSRDARRRQRAQSRSQIRNDRNTNARRPGSSLDRDALKDAENAVFANDTCGPDGIRPSQLSQFDRTGLRNYLAGEKSWPVRRFQIGRFVPGPYRTVDIGGRQIHIRGVLDRLVLGALDRTVRPLVRFAAPELSFGFAEQRGPSALFAWFSDRANDGRRFMIATDIRRAFPSINRRRVAAVLEQQLPRCSCRKALKRVLRSYDTNGTPGLLTGDATSPLLFELTMSHDVDSAFVGDEQVRYARWIDNIYLAAEEPGLLVEALQRLEASLAPSGLQLHPERNQVVDLSTDLVTVLGYRIRIGNGRIDFLFEGADLDARLQAVLDRLRSSARGSRNWRGSLAGFVASRRMLVRQHPQEFRSWADTAVNRIVTSDCGPNSRTAVRSFLAKVIDSCLERAVLESAVTPPRESDPSSTS